MPLLAAAEIEVIANALGNTELGLTGREVEHLIGACRMIDPGPIAKARRLYNAFAESQNTKQNRTHILEFIRMAMAPARYAREPSRYEPMRANLNQALAFAGLMVDDAGWRATLRQRYPSMPGLTEQSVRRSNGLGTRRTAFRELAVGSFAPHRLCRRCRTFGELALGIAARG